MADQDVDLMAHLLRRAGFGASRDEIEAKLAQGFQDLLLLLSTDPAMIYYLDNCESHKDAVNENYGRELLELFSMGVGMDGEFNYTEDDVKACARAFTGWNIAPDPPFWPYGRSLWEFCYDPTDHDDSEKTFLGETGRFNGEDIIDIICKQPATARFISRKLYDFFVADEPPVPAWRQTEPRDMAAIKMLEKAYFDSGYEIKAMLQTLLKSDFFKSEPVRFARIQREDQRSQALEVFKRIYSPAVGTGAVVDYIDRTGISALKGADILSSAPGKYSSQVEYPNTQVGQYMKAMAQVHLANFGTLILYATTPYNSFDTHANQAAKFAGLWQDVANSVETFFDDLRDHQASQEVVMLLFSEFGRRVTDNGSGTDHGTGGVTFVVGESVKGGFYGEYPSLVKDKLEDGGDLLHNLDFRSIYSTLAERWLELDPAPIVGGHFETVDFL